MELYVTLPRLEELIKKEAQLDFIKNWARKQNDYANVSDLKILLDICEGGKEDEN